MIRFKEFRPPGYDSDSSSIDGGGACHPGMPCASSNPAEGMRWTTKLAIVAAAAIAAGTGVYVYKRGSGTPQEIQSATTWAVPVGGAAGGLMFYFLFVRASG
jgi:hypothetical protein